MKVQWQVSRPPSAQTSAPPAQTREALGISDGLIRLSVGIEDGADLVDDLRQALERAR